jgi:hypothetical protein
MGGSRPVIVLEASRVTMDDLPAVTLRSILEKQLLCLPLISDDWKKRRSGNELWGGIASTIYAGNT